LPTARLIGIDRFCAMLRIGQTRCRSAVWIQADGPRLPLASRSVDYATSQFSYPHIRRPRELAAEVFRVLKAGGRFVMTNIDPWSMPGWLVYRYFPEAEELDRQDFMPTERFAAVMGDAGFEDVRVSGTDLSRDERLNEFLVYVSTRHRASQLMAISDAAYNRGLQRLREAVAKAGPDLDTDCRHADRLLVSFEVEHHAIGAHAKHVFDCEAPLDLVGMKIAAMQHPQNE